MNKSMKLLLAFWAVAALTAGTAASAHPGGYSGGNMMGQAMMGSGAMPGGMNMHQGRGGGMQMQQNHGQMRARHMMMGQEAMHGYGAGMPGMMGSGHKRFGQKGFGQMGFERHMGGGMRVTPIQHLSVDDVSHFFGHRLERRGNKRLKLGEVSQIDEDTISVKIVTVDGSLVQAFEVDRHSGFAKRVD